jgi:uncharacterized Zn finger protein
LAKDRSKFTIPSDGEFMVGKTTRNGGEEMASSLVTGQLGIDGIK